MDALTPARIVARLRAKPALAVQEALPARPVGRVFWAHAPDGVRAAPLVALAERMQSRIGVVHIVVTGGPSVTGPRLLHSPAPAENSDAIARFLRHWRPDAAFWIGDTHAPLVLDAVARTGLPLFLVNASAPPGAERPGARRVRRLLLGKFSHILARDAAAGRALRALADARVPVTAAGPLSQLSRPLLCAETDREEFAEAIAVRPVWLAVTPSPAELEAVLLAHRSIVKGAHRLLLLLVPPNPDDGPDLVADLRAAGWSVASRGADELPRKGDEIYVADTLDELGLWYRLAPLCFMGGTLTTGAVRDPMEAAALGSAIIAGPVGGRMTANLDRLDEVGGLRRITRPDTLARAVSDLMSPDRAAVLAQAAWDVATDGAEVEEQLARLLCDAVNQVKG